MIYDSRVLHCGSANRSSNRCRAIFYFSFRHPDIMYPGNPPSIRHDLQVEQLTLESLMNSISTIHRKNGVNPFPF